MNFIYLFWISLFITQTSWTHASEGLHGTQTRSLNALTKTIADFYDLNQKESQNLKAILSNSIQASFQIECDHNIATGFFIDREGRFITAAHFFDSQDTNKSYECNISYNELKKGYIHSIKKTVTFKILSLTSPHLKGFQLTHSFDQSLAQIENFQPKHYLTISKKLVRPGQHLLLLGSPMLTNRFLKKTVLPKLIDSESQFMHFCQSNQAQVEMLKKQHFLIDGRSAAMINKLCVLGKQNRIIKISGTKIYDEVENTSGEIYINLGHVQSIFYPNMLGDFDILPGFSGGPAIDLLTGHVHGVISFSIQGEPTPLYHFQDQTVMQGTTSAVYYSGAAGAQILAHP